MKKKQTRDKATPVQEKDLVSVKGSSGYNIATGEEGSNPPNPDGPP